MEMKAYMVNRLALMLLEHNEEMSMEQALSIVFNSDTYQKMMDDRMILKSDVVRVMQSLRETGEAILDEDSGLYVTRTRLGNVTFWVKYKETEGGYAVHSAYSHRMNILNR